MINENDVDKLVNKLEKKLKIPVGSWNISYSKGKRKTRKRMYIQIHLDKQSIFGKFPLDIKDKSLVREAILLDRISVKEFLIPKVILKTNEGFFMSAINGLPIELDLKEKGLLKGMRILNEAVAKIARFHKKTNVDKTDIGEIKIDSLLNEQSPSYKKEILSRINTGYTHGDLDPFNMFFDRKTDHFGLIDWEDFKKKGIQELDILHFLIMTAVILYPSDDYKTLYRKIFLKNTLLHRVFLKLIDIYCKIINQDANNIINLLPIYCDMQIQRLLNASRNPNDFLYKTFKNQFERYGTKNV